MTLRRNDFFGSTAAVEPAPPPRQLELVKQMVREISLQTDPQAMVAVFRRRAHLLYGADNSISLSRRGLEAPWYRITRSTTWAENINPWLEPHRLPLLRGGLLAEMIYENEPRVINDLEVNFDDPAHEYLKDAQSLISLPLYEDGVAVNMVVRLSREPWNPDETQLAHALLEANLIGRATSHLLLAQRLRTAYGQLDHELKRVAEIQHALLPERLPEIPGVDLAVSYQTAARAGGDYYDLFDLGDNRWGILIADVSGHGTPAAVVMAMMRTILHAQCHACLSAAELLERVNGKLCDRFTRFAGTFVTAFYGILDLNRRSLLYACAGHNPPLWVSSRADIRELDDVQAFPLAVDPSLHCEQTEITFSPGDVLLLYTDGIIEAKSPTGEMYGRDRLLGCIREDVPNAQHIIDCITLKLQGFTGNQPQEDDQTLLAVRIDR